MKKNLFVLCGLPGSGKSTYASKTFNTSNDIIISRDKIRFSLLKDNDEYFSKEDEVYNKFINDINFYLSEKSNKKNIIVDQTNLNLCARYRLLHKLNLKNVNNLIAIYFDIPLDVCIQRNNQRTGRALVPENVIRDMSKKLVVPDESEGFNSILIAKEK